MSDSPHGAIRIHHGRRGFLTRQGHRSGDVAAARAIYLYQGKQDTHLRIHGTIAPQTIGTNSSNGCFRMVNEHVIDLYGRVGVGTRVVVL